MKTKLILLLVLPFTAVIAQNGNGARKGAGSSFPGDCPRGGDCPLVAVSAANPTTLATADLVAAFDEERMAQDLYLAAAQRWNLPVFSNIAAAETRHAGVFIQLAATAGLTLQKGQSGTYASAETQRLYEQLLPLMSGSAVGALKAGALIEETNITDLRQLARRATDELTRNILAQLERASMQHLRAFVQNLAGSGVTYQPQVLTADEFSLVLASQAAGGRGRGYRGSR